jgi:hypothetical protein
MRSKNKNSISDHPIKIEKNEKNEKSEYEECVDDVYKIFELQEKIANGLIVQMYYISFSESILQGLLASTKHNILNKRTNGHRTYIDIEFEDSETSKYFIENVPKNSNFSILTKEMMLSGNTVPKPSRADVVNRRNFLIGQNCDHLCS